MTSTARPTRPPPLQAPPRLVAPIADRVTLANGMRVLVIERRRLPVADALLVVPSGAAADSPATAGRACLTADLVDAGTANRSQIDIAIDLDSIGARLDAAAGWDHTTIALHTLSTRLDRGFELFADVALQPGFPEDEFRRGRAERLAAILQELDDPDTLADLAIAGAIFGSHHIYGMPAGGTRETVGRLERDTLVRFHTDRYRPADAFLVIAGDVSTDVAVSAIDRVFGDWTAPGVAPPLPQWPAPVHGPLTVHLLDRPGAPQSEVRIGTVGAARSSPDYFPLVVMNTVLGGSFTSRLNVRLREKGGYTYGAFSGFAFRSSPGPFVAGAAVDTEATGRAIAESLEEMLRMREEPVPADELERAKRYLMLGLPRAFETSGGIASRIAETELYALGESYWQRYPDRIAAVSAADVQEAARKYLGQDRLSIVVVGDAAIVRSPLERLGIGPVDSAAPPE